MNPLHLIEDEKVLTVCNLLAYLIFTKDHSKTVAKFGHFQLRRKLGFNAALQTNIQHLGQLQIHAAEEKTFLGYLMVKSRLLSQTQILKRNICEHKMIFNPPSLPLPHFLTNSTVRNLTSIPYINRKEFKEVNNDSECFAQLCIL